MRLSIELVDHIFSFLQSDPVSLQACRKSHPLLSQLAERYQFADVVLDDFNFGFTFKFAFTSSKFTKIIQRHPHIATYIRSINMRLGVDKYSSELSSILPMMTLLNKVKLDGLSICRWQAIPEHFRQAFLDCIHLPSMEDVQIIQFSDFPLPALNNIKRLKLCGWTEDEYLPDTNYQDDSLGHQLESLSLEDFGRGSLQKIIAWVPSTLRSLDISGRDFASLIKCSNSLTNLQLNLGPECASSLSMDSTLQLNLSLVCSGFIFMPRHAALDSPGENFPFTLSTLLHLEGLTVRAELEFSSLSGSVDRRFYHPILAIEHAMTTISSQTLKFLKLDFNFMIDTHEALPPAEVIWSSLVHLVAESPFPCIELHVRVTFYGWGVHQDIAPDIILNSLAESAELMSYVNRGVLVITSEPPVTNKQDGLVEKASPI